MRKIISVIVLMFVLTGVFADIRISTNGSKAINVKYDTSEWWELTGKLSDVFIWKKDVAYEDYHETSKNFEWKIQSTDGNVIVVDFDNPDFDKFFQYTNLKMNAALLGGK